MEEGGSFDVTPARSAPVERGGGIGGRAALGGLLGGALLVEVPEMLGRLRSAMTGLGVLGRRGSGSLGGGERGGGAPPPRRIPGLMQRGLAEEEEEDDEEDAGPKGASMRPPGGEGVEPTREALRARPPLIIR